MRSQSPPHLQSAATAPEGPPGPSAAARAQRAVLVEVGAGQAADVCGLFKQAGLIDVRTRRDLGGHERVVSGRIG